MTIEIWRAVQGYEGYYEISNLGKLKSLDRMVRQGNHYRHVYGKIKHPHYTAYGYPAYTLCKNCKSKVIPIHLLVARAFIPNPENKKYIDHINTNKEDYSISNLRWVTAKENANNPLTLKHCQQNTYKKEIIAKALRTKILRKTKTAPRKVYCFDKYGNFLNEYESSKDAERQTSINACSIGYACSGKRFSAGGLLWSYKKCDIPKYVKRTYKNAKIVLQFDVNNKLIKEWPTIKSAAESVGRCASNFVRDVKINPLRYGYKWIIKNDAMT